MSELEAEQKEKAVEKWDRRWQAFLKEIIQTHAA